MIVFREPTMNPLDKKWAITEIGEVRKVRMKVKADSMNFGL
jgi:hypothetical protein